MEENKQIEDIQEDYLYTTYLIGAMEKPSEKDDGSSKREEVEKELLLRDVYPINPVKLESGKTGMTTEELKEKMTGWVAGGSWDIFTEKAQEIWLGTNGLGENGSLLHVMGDIDYVKISDWITFLFKKGDICCGSFAECGVAVEHHIPIYLVTNFAKKDLPKSLLQIVLASKGEVFENLNHYFEFVDKEYHLKRKEEK